MSRALEEIEALWQGVTKPRAHQISEENFPRLLEIAQELRAEVARRPRVGYCVWSLTETIDDAEWSSTCGHEWQFLAGGPIENEVKFCPFCGGEIEIEASSAAH
jgi:hypothetical protein